MLWNLLWSVPFGLVAVVGAVVAARAPQGSPWRVPAVLGFGLLAVSQLVSMSQQAMLVYSAGSGPSLYALVGVIAAVSSVISLAGTVLLVVAFARVPRVVAALGWGGAPAAVGPPPPHPPAAPGGAYAPAPHATAGYDAEPVGLRKAPGTDGAPSTEAPRTGAGG